MGRRRAPCNYYRIYDNRESRAIVLETPLEGSAADPTGRLEVPTRSQTGGLNVLAAPRKGHIAPGQQSAWRFITIREKKERGQLPIATRCRLIFIDRWKRKQQLDDHFTASNLWFICQPTNHVPRRVKQLVADEWEPPCWMYAPMICLGGM